MATNHSVIGVGAPRALRGAMSDAASVITALRWRVTVKDGAFDGLYPEEIRRQSAIHWTPVSVALRAATWLAPESGTRVLDVGSGPGKVCLIGALVRPARWHGVERDASLVAVAIATATLLGVDDATVFHAGDMDCVDWGAFDSFYFFNPFAAILFGPAPFAQEARFAMLTDQIARTEARLADAAVGTRVVTYQGFGGDVPDSYALAFAETIADGRLTLWIKQPSRRRLTR